MDSIKACALCLIGRCHDRAAACCARSEHSAATCSHSPPHARASTAEVKDEASGESYWWCEETDETTELGLQCPRAWTEVQDPTITSGPNTYWSVSGARANCQPGATPAQVEVVRFSHARCWFGAGGARTQTRPPTLVRRCLTCTGRTRLNWQEQLWNSSVTATPAAPRGGARSTVEEYLHQSTGIQSNAPLRGGCPCLLMSLLSGPRAAVRWEMCVMCDVRDITWHESANDPVRCGAMCDDRTWVGSIKRFIKHVS